ncbi:MAG: glycosyltransferase [Deinococcota bacterium]
MTPATPLASIIIPTYNRPERLAQALRSLQVQRDSHWEAWVVDDGDGRGASLARAYGDARIHALVNAGSQQVDARNTAISHASGEIIAWLDDDDWWAHPDHLGRLKQALSKATLAHVHGWIVYEAANGKQTKHLFDLPATPESLHQDNTLLTSSIAYPSVFHKELGLLDRNMNGYFDWDWILRVMDAGYSLTTINMLSVCYLMHGGNGSADVLGPRRVRDFTAFKTKHHLDIEIKSHELVLNESPERFDSVA